MSSILWPPKPLALYYQNTAVSFITPSHKDPIRLKMARDRTRTIKQGFPWIYGDWLAELPPAPPGSRAIVRDKDGTLLAFGMYDPSSPLAVRVCAVEQERLDDELILARCRSALALRRTLFAPQKDSPDITTGYRLLNGEGDGVPGLQCDLYADHAVLKLDGDGPKCFWNLHGFAEWLTESAGAKVVFNKFRADEQSRGEVVSGDLGDSGISFLEHGHHFKADIVAGQKSGFFLDQRENRARITTHAADRRVLNLCGYTGGFSVYAGIGGARHVTTVDLAKPALADAKVNWRLNGLPEDRHTTVAGDVFEYLREARARHGRWDLIIVDPPSFASAERHVPQATESYQALFTAALQVLESGGMIALSSCSSHIPLPKFMDICESALSKARVRATVLGVYGQPEDHPFPFACTELQYLKFLLLSVK